MNTLVLGGNGFIGSHLVDKLLKEKHDVTVFDRNKEFFRESLKGVKYIYADFGNRQELSNALKNIDVVFHLISTTLPKTSNEDPIFDVSSNVLETLHLLNECVRLKIPKIVFLSSGGVVYGIPKVLPIDENCIANPLCSYGITKQTIEKYIILYNYLYGINYSIIRPANAYGERQNPANNQGIISVLIKNIIDKKPVQIWGDGKVIRDYVWVKDLSAGIYSAALNQNSEIFNLGSGLGYTIKDILEILKEITEINFEIKYQPSRNFDVPAIYLDISKAKQILRWEPTVSLREGIESSWKYFNNFYRCD
ncbi:MAG: NAD-dependent epimerase/dehydratase family protein [Ignavibacteriales bacterium]|nr:NAD-dependent epimerase/dehydratase family protein [Ignavibacteriales bacterium]